MYKRMCVKYDILCKQKALWKLLLKTTAGKSLFPSGPPVSMERLSFIYLFLNIKLAVWGPNSLAKRKDVYFCLMRITGSISSTVLSKSSI